MGLIVVVTPFQKVRGHFGVLMKRLGVEVLVTFRHPQNVQPTQYPRVHYVHCDILSPDEIVILRPTSPWGGHNVAVTI